VRNKKTNTDDQHLANSFVDKARLVLGDNLERAYWFGSRSRGDGEPDSDFDLMLETVTPVTEKMRDKVADISIDMAADYGVLMDVHFYSSGLLQNPLIARSPFILSVHEEGIRI